MLSAHTQSDRVPSLLRPLACFHSLIQLEHFLLWPLNQQHQAFYESLARNLYRGACSSGSTQPPSTATVPSSSVSVLGSAPSHSARAACAVALHTCRARFLLQCANCDFSKNEGEYGRSHKRCKKRFLKFLIVLAQLFRLSISIVQQTFRESGLCIDSVTRTYRNKLTFRKGLDVD